MLVWSGQIANQFLLTCSISRFNREKKVEITYLPFIQQFPQRDQQDY